MAIKLNPLGTAISICFLAVLTCGMGSAQRRDRSIFQFQHTSWTAKDGVPSPIYSLAQTPDGYLWMATPSGLYRFDGIQFELYQPSSGQRFRSDSIRSLLATPDGGLWIGFTYGGADLLKDGRITSYDSTGGLPSGTVLEFALDRDAVVWVVTTSGVGRFDGSRWQPIQRNWGYSGDEASALFVDRDGTLWVASEDALFFLLRGKREFRKYADHLGHTSSIGQTPDGTLWLSEREHGASDRDWAVHTIRPTPVLPTAGVQPLPRIEEIDAILTSFIDHTGSLWIASPDGLFRMPYPERLEKNRSIRLDEHTAQRFQPRDGLTSVDITEGAMIEDSQGDIWIGTGTGLDRFREANVVPVPVTGLDARPLLVVGSHGDAWTYQLSFLQGALVDLRGLTANSQPTQASAPTAGYRDDNGAIWLGGPNGLWKSENGRLVRYPLPEAVNINRQFHDVQAITGDAAGGLWVSIAGNEVWRWMSGVWSHFGDRHDLPDETPVCLLADSAGRIWFGYMNSSMALLDGNVVKTFSTRDGLQVVNIQALYQRAGHLWIGGERGLALFRDNRFQSLTPDGNAGFTGVSGIVERSNGDLWLNATPGIFRIPASEIERAIKEPSYHVHCDLFGILDGLTGKAVQLRPIPTEVESSDGLLWFSTNAGIFQINPSHLLRNAIPPSVYIRSVDSGGVLHSGLGAMSFGTMNLPPRSTDVHIEYTAPNLSVPERVRYRYQLEGLDKGWQDAGTRREAFYTNLGPHHYRFRVIASNEDGVWSKSGADVEFTIAPAWFQTTWFHICGVAAFLLLLWAAYLIRVRQLGAQFAAELGARVDERTRIARELHDTLLQSFQGAVFQFQAARRLLLRNADNAMGVVDEAIQAAEQGITEGRAAIHDLRPEPAAQRNLPELLNAAGRELAGNREQNAHPPGFRVTVEGKERSLALLAQDEVHSIAREVIRNAFHHAGASHIEVEIHYDVDQLRVRIHDDGKGIDPRILEDGGRPGHWGISGMRERAQRIGAQLTFWSEVGAGTEVQLTVAGAIAYEKHRFRRRAG